MRPLVLFSGGVESTSLAKHLLESTEFPIVLHHLRRYSPEHRVLAEDRAVAALIPELKKIRDFEFSTSEVSICDSRPGAYPDWLIDYPIGLAALYTHGCRQILRAGCLEDDWDHGRDGSCTRPSPEPGFSHRRRASSLAALLPPGVDPHQVAPYLDWYKNPKAWHWEYLGALAPLTWSCRRPVNDYEPCGTCHACHERAAAIAGTSAIPAVAAVLRLGDTGDTEGPPVGSGVVAYTEHHQV